ncbi:matrixin family metalloprotease [Nibricoccus sp. IMCC34717]|uniref:matrixin family metalloprotease n=1 Tax=Nibricoccus sp. IMCC34717 TaxID=3034021 RepID=UPI00384EE983
MRLTPFRLAAVLFTISASLATVLRGYALLDTPKWPDGVIQLTYNLGNQVTYRDGKTPNQVADVAANSWNQYVSRVRFEGKEGTAGSSSANNGQNNVFFASDVRGTAFGVNVLAVALNYERSGVKESDVIVNSTQAWGSAGESGKYDLSRVLIHEYGHVLGLGHPDEAGQNVDAIMNSIIGWRTSQSEDDALGVASLYGETPLTPKLAILYEPTDVTVYEGESAYFSVSPSYYTQVTYQWKLNGVAMAGATQSSFSLSTVKQSDAGLYSVEVSDGVRKLVSREAKLSVLAVTPPVITQHPGAVDTFEGQSFSFYVGVEGRNLTIEWYKDGVLIPNERYSSFYRYNASFADQGSYYAKISNIAGSVTTTSAKLRVKPAPLPSSPLLTSASVNQGGSLFLQPSFYAFGNYTYQWYKDGTPIPGATQVSYSKSTVTDSDAGEYAVLISTGGRSVASRTATVDVVPVAPSNALSWVGIQRIADLVYIAYENPARVERYSLSENKWLAPLAFSKSITAFAARGTSLFIAFGRTVSQFNLDGTGEKALFNNDSVITEMIAANSWLIFPSGGYYGEIRVYNIVAGGPPVISSSSYDMRAGYSYNEKHSLLYGVSVGISPSDIARGVIDGDGTIKAIKDSPYHGAYFPGNRTIVLPGEDKVTDTGGTVYDALTLEFIGSFGKIDDLGFRADGTPVGLIGRNLYLYDAHFNKVGKWRLSKPGSRVFVSGSSAFVFNPATVQGSTSCEKIELTEASLERPSQAAAKDGTTSLYYSASAVLDRDGNVLLFSPLDRQIFRWSPSERKYLSGYGLRGMPAFFSYARETDSIYLGYSNDTITRLDKGTGQETAVVTTARRLLGLAASDRNVVGVDESGAWCSHSLYRDNGERLSWKEWNYTSDEYTWDPVNQRMYQLQGSGGLMYTEYNPDQTFGSQKQGSYYDTALSRLPIRVSPGGDVILLGSGQMVSAYTLTKSNSLANDIDDGAWLGGRLYSIARTENGCTVQRWGGNNYIEDATLMLPGSPKRLLALDTGQLLVVHEVKGQIAFSILNADLGVEFSQVPTISGSRLTSISSRSKVGLGGDAMIAGFATRGSGTTRLLVRAVGPKLGSFGVAGFLLDPKVEIFDSSGAKLMTNDDWSSDSSSVSTLKQAFSISGLFAFDDYSRDSALIADLPAGGYTAIVSGVGGLQGVGLVEVYTANIDAPGPQLIGISTRAKVGTGADVLIGGFAVTGKSPKRVLIRGIGPALASFGVSGVLTDPKLTLYSGDKAIASNDNWGGASDLTAAFSSAGSFALPLDSKDSALLTTLEPGNYTAIVEGVDNTAGVALVEIYEVPE